MPAAHVSFIDLDSGPPQITGVSPIWRELVLPMGCGKGDQARLDALRAKRCSVPRGKALFRNGDDLSFLYEVYTGQFKTCIAGASGHSQVTGFKMTGELLGLDGISTGRHALDAVALEDSQVCAIPYDELIDLLRELVALQRRFHRMMSREIVRSHALMMLLGSMYAQERVAAFLLDLTLRLSARGFSPSSAVLRMSRTEIGNYLGLKLETVCRIFSRLQRDGVLDVKHRHLRVIDVQALQRIAPSSVRRQERG